jgi:hypothetical protein
MSGPDKQTNDPMEQAFMTEGVGISAEQFQELRDRQDGRSAARCIDGQGSYHNAEPPGDGCQ